MNIDTAQYSPEHLGGLIRDAFLEGWSQGVRALPWTPEEAWEGSISFYAAMKVEKMVAVLDNSAGEVAVKKAILDAFKSSKESAEKNPSRFGGYLTPLVPHSGDAKK